MVPGRVWLSAVAHLLALFTLAQRGAFAPDGIIAVPVPLTIVLWILAEAATLPWSRRAATSASVEGTGQLYRPDRVVTRLGGGSPLSPVCPR